MGPQQVLRAAAAVVVTASVSLAAAAPVSDRAAVIDLGPGEARQKIEAALVARGVALLQGDGIADALAGTAVDRDVLALAGAMADAQSKFGALQCAETIAAAQTAITIAAGRQAAGIAVPELPRAWTYILLCADRASDSATAHAAATHLRTLSATGEVDRGVLARYPEIDAISNRELLPLEITAEVPGAEIWIDFRRAGVAPMKTVLPAGTHVIAAASGSKRGVLTGTVVRAQPQVTVPMPDQSSPHAALAARVAGWRGVMPSPSELADVMRGAGVRVAIVRHGDTVEAWGHAGLAEPLRRLGDMDGVRPLAEVDALAALVADRIATWNDRSPDPDQPLLVETPEERRRYSARSKEDEPTPWWVYATIGAAVVVGGAVIYAHQTADNTQRIEITYPGLRL